MASLSALLEVENSVDPIGNRYEDDLRKIDAGWRVYSRTLVNSVSDF